ncbi:MAG: EAL domain-containing protein [Acidimicrobiia bacterium]|nr:EAL domain-containing protein [Acidimicrobiia bacterium]
MSTRAAPSPTIRHLEPSARWFVALVAGLNLAVVAVMVLSPWYRVDAAAGAQVLLLLMGAMVLAELRPAGSTGPASDLAGAVSWILAASLVLLGAPAVAVVTLTATTLAGEIIRREPLTHGIFNASQLSLSIAAGATVIRLLEQQDALTPTGEIDVVWLPAAALAGTTVIFVNGLLTGIVRSLGTKTPLPTSIRAAIDGTLRSGGVLLTLAPVMAVLAVRSPLLLPMPLVTALAVYRKANEANRQELAASQDILTGLPNRRDFERRVDEALESHAPGAVALIDLDGFKAVNDRLGHQAGDEVLKGVADHIIRHCRADDVPARLGGDEFAVFLHGLPEEVEKAAKKMVAAVREPVQVGESPVRISASLGLALTPAHGTHLRTLLERADATMYRAKRERLGVAVYDPSATVDSQGLARLQRSLRDALLADEFEAHFQPWVDARSGTVLGIECLARWPRSDRVVLMPDQFLPLIRDPELAHQLTATMLERALARAEHWHQDGFEVPLSVNVPLVTARSRGLVKDLDALLRVFPIDPGLLQLEISDRGLAADDPELRNRLHTISKLGVGLVIDDFGTGADSLTSLASLGARTVKLSTRLTQGLFSRPGALTVVHHLMAMGRDLGVAVVAKQVESPDVARAITQAGGAIQGHLVVPACPADELTDWLVERRTQRPAELRDPTVAPPSSW